MWANAKAAARQKRAIATFESIRNDLPAGYVRQGRVKEVSVPIQGPERVVHGPDVAWLTVQFELADNTISALQRAQKQNWRDLLYWQGRRDVCMEMLDAALGKGWKGGTR